MKFKNSVVTQNITRDFSICSEHNSLILSQIATKLWPFYPLIVVNQCTKYQDQKVFLSYKKKKNTVKMSREIIIRVVLRSFLKWISYSWSAMSITYQSSKFDPKFKKQIFRYWGVSQQKTFFLKNIFFCLMLKIN